MHHQSGRIKNRLVIICSLVFLQHNISLAQSNQKLDWITKVGAKQFPTSKKIFKINAISDTSKVVTKTIQSAIDECAKSGGGIVIFSPGTYVTGSIFIKSNVQLRIDKQVLLLGSQNFDDYPEIDTRIAGIEMKWPAALINIINVKNAAVTGNGIVNARGKFCWDKYWAMRKEYDAKALRWIVDYDAKRVRTVLVQHSSDITLKGMTFKNAGFWTVQLLYSNHVTVDGVIIRNNEDGHGPSTDGVDVDSSAWILVENCDIDCNDDNFCLKAGRDWDGLRVNKPTEYVLIKKCLARRGGGLVTLGSETSGGIRHVLATDLYATHTDNGLRIKSAFTRGGVVEDIHFTNSVMDSVNNAYQFNLNWNPAYSYSELPKGYSYDSVPAHWKAMLNKVTPPEKGIPHAKNIYVENVKATNAQVAFGGTGYELSLLENFVFTNCSISAKSIGLLEFTKGWKFNNVTIDVEKKAAVITEPASKEEKRTNEKLIESINLMKSLHTSIIYFLFILSNISIKAQRVVQSFDADWKFLKADVKGAEQINFDGAQWRSLNVPHDWSIEGPYDRNNITGRGGGYLPDGVGWYRKNFSLTDEDAKKSIFIEFDGIMANSDVWINGYHLGKRPNGYISFQYELTSHLNFGKEKKNVIAVRADNSIQPASRWYTGAGIYRHVRLVITNPVHIAHWGSFISSSNVSAEKATVQVQTAVTNQSSTAVTIVLQTNIVTPDGKIVESSEATQKISNTKDETIVSKIEITKPLLWDVDKPQLYKAVTKILVDKRQVDEVSTFFGIRDAKFEAATGFWLNGKNIKIKGVCLHHDGGAVGAAVPLAVWKRKLSLLKEVGTNAIRTSHNPPSPEFLDLCDQMGFLVMDETFDTWNAKKSNAENGYNLYFTDWWERDTHDMVMRDRNHPSIIIYSVGNEIHDNLNDSTGFRKYKMQQDLIHSLDATRPVTMALFRPALSHVYENGFANMMDVVGQNYRENELVAAHENNPLRKVLGTENRHELAAWIPVSDKPYMAGQFLWCGFDYLGEADWPVVVNGQGLFDRTGGARNITYQRKSWWTNKPMLYVMRKQGNAGAGDWISDWSPTDIDTYDEAQIQVFSNCDEVELFLNGKSVGIKSRPDDNASPRTWSITFQKGALKAVAKNNGQIVAEQELKTAGPPAKIVLSADRSTIENNWDDVVFVRATITDENGIPCLNADSKIKFSVEGSGFIAATDNADLTNTELFSSHERWAYKGTCIAIIKANANNGMITVKANIDNLKYANITLQAKIKK